MSDPEILEEDEMNKFVVLAWGLALAGCAGCAGRAPMPVQMAQPEDQGLSCAAIGVEVEANGAKMAELEGDRQAKVAQNVAAVAVGVVFTPLLFLADFQGTAGIEIEALQQRQQYLGVLAGQKGCEVPHG